MSRWVSIALPAILILVLTFTTLPASTAAAAVMTFDNEPLGTEYGPTHAPGDIVLTEDGITMSVEEFHASGYVNFDMAYIDELTWFGEDQVLRFNNIACEFDFTGTGEAPDTVYFDYGSQGGTKNLSVNGGTTWETRYWIDLDGVVVAPGVTCLVTEESTAPNFGFITLVGPVTTVVIGGQEDWIDRVRIGENDGNGNGHGHCDIEVTHDLEPLGAAWGGLHGDVVGDVAFTEDGVPVTLLRYYDGSGGYSFDECVIDSETPDFGDLQTLRFNNINVAYETNALAEPVAAVTFFFASHGGEENLMVNGGPLFIGDIESAPVEIATGVEYYVLNSWSVPGGIAGEVLLVGNVQRLITGGQEYWVDEVCVYVDEDGIADGCDILVDFESQPMSAAWGVAHGDLPGDQIFIENGVPVSIHSMRYFGGTTGFIEAKIDPATNTCLELNTMGLNNITTAYDIAATGVTPALVYFDYYKTGGYENLKVNGAPAYIGNMDAAPYSIAPGVTCTVIASPMGGGECGRVILRGNVRRLGIAGQEFHMDNLCIIVGSEGSPDICHHELQFEDQLLGDAWGIDHMGMPGDVIFMEDSVPVSIWNFYDGSNWVFHNCTITTAWPDAGVTDGQALGYGGISVQYDISGLGNPVKKVTFEFIDWDSDENLQVNGHYIYYGELLDMPLNIAPDVTMEIDWWPISGGEAAGVVTLTGNVQTLLLGAQQFLVDNICVTLLDLTEVEISTPTKTGRLLQPPFPNPFNPSTTLSFNLDRSSQVRMSVHDVAGRQIDLLADGVYEAGRHRIVWDGRDAAGRGSSSGVYFVRIVTDVGTDTRKLVLMK